MFTLKITVLKMTNVVIDIACLRALAICLSWLARPVNSQNGLYRFERELAS